MGSQALRDTLPTMSSIVPVVLSGGVGTRLWPLSRQGEPKQFQTLIGSDSMLAQTLARVEGLGDRTLIVAGLAHVPELQATDAQILAEPAGRNTAPAVAAAALSCGPDDILIVMPADHHISDLTAFRDALEHAITAARDGWLTTFGIVPDRPETGYGYLVPESSEDSPARRIVEFIEKPNSETASQLIAKGALWNSGMFVFPVAVLLAELERLQPELLTVVRAAVASATTHSWGRQLGTDFLTAPNLSIDVAVMEQTPQAAVVRLEAGWSDIGSWSAVWDLGAKDRSGNVVVGPVTMLDSARNYLRSDGPPLAVSGVEDLIVVATLSGVLVTKRDRAQSVKDLFELIEPEDR